MKNLSKLSGSTSKLSMMIPKIRNWIVGHKRLSIAIALVLVVAIVIWRVVASRQTTPQYQTATVQKGTIVSTVSASGTVLSSNIMNVTTQASGIVKTVFVKDGDQVSAGQEIAEITPDLDSQQRAASALASYDGAKASLAGAQANYWTLQSAEFVANQKFINDAAARNLATNDPTYIEEWAQWLAAEAQFNNNDLAQKQAQASLNSAWLSYKQSSPIIYAPTSGTISSLGLVEGMVLAAQTSATSGQTSSQRVAVIQNQANPILTFSITEIDAPNVKIGQEATITLDSLPNKTFTGKVMTMDRIGVSSSNVTSYTALIQLDSPAPDILPNMAANANIIIQTKDNVLTVPSTAIQTSSNQSYVSVLKNGQVQQVNVTTGISSDTDTEITSGLNEGDVVITGTAATTTSSSTRSLFGGAGGIGGALRVGGR